MSVLPAAADPAASAQEAAAANARAPLFGSLSRLDLAKLVAELEELSFDPGEYVVRKGEPGDAYYIVRSGTAAVCTAGRSRTGCRSSGTSGLREARPSW